MFVQSGFAQTRSVGVSEGDWFKYGFTFEFDTEMNLSFEDCPLADFIDGETVTFTIQQVSGTEVTGQFDIEYENGSETSKTASVDVDTGEGELRNWVISKDLGADDSLYSVETEETINETIPRTYNLNDRDTNHLMYAFYATLEEEGDYSNLTVDMFWDQELGVLTELSFAAEVQLNGTYMEMSAACVITESNLEDIPEFTQTAFIATAAAVALLIVVIKKKGKLEHV
jgi:hypothetical protein